jgi:hypothetical protein
VTLSGRGLAPLYGLDMALVSAHPALLIGLATGLVLARRGMGIAAGGPRLIR